MRRFVTLFFFLCSLAWPQDKDFERNLRQRLEGQLVLLSGTNLSNGLEYDRDGKPLKPLKADEWVDWTARECHVNRIRVSPESVGVDCEFFFMSYGDGEHDFHPIRMNAYHDSWMAWNTVKIKRSTEDEDQDVLHALDKVFVTTDVRFNSELPTYWKPFFSLPKEMRAGYATKIEQQTREEILSLRSKGKLEPATTGGWLVDFAGVVPTIRVRYGVGGRSLNLTADRKGAVYFIVDETGAAKDFQVVKPIGLGMEHWIETQFVKAKYKPALLNGKPVQVPVLLNYSIGYE